MASNVKGKGDLARDAPDAESTGDLERKRILHCNRAAFIRFTHFFLEAPVNDNTCGMMLTITVKKRENMSTQSMVKWHLPSAIALNLLR